MCVCVCVCLYLQRPQLCEQSCFDLYYDAKLDEQALRTLVHLQTAEARMPGTPPGERQTCSRGNALPRFIGSPQSLSLSLCLCVSFSKECYTT